MGGGDAGDVWHGAGPRTLFGTLVPCVVSIVYRDVVLCGGEESYGRYYEKMVKGIGCHFSLDSAVRSID